MVPLLFIAGFVIFGALLWWLASWFIVASRSSIYAVVCVSVLFACAALVIYGLYFSASIAIRHRFHLEHWQGPVVLPLFLALPVAVCIVVSQLLFCSGVSKRKVRVTSTVLGAASVIFVPFGVLFEWTVEGGRSTSSMSALLLRR